MTLNDYCEYIRNPLAEAKTRVLIMPPGESWTTLRRFCQERGDVEVHLSELVSENAWLPMPDEIFERVRNAMSVPRTSGKTVVLLGLPGYLALLTDENKLAAITALREWVDDASGRNAVCLLRNDDGTEMILKAVFTNPRYRQGKQLIEIDAEPAFPRFAAIRSARLTPASEEKESSAGRTEVMLVGHDLATFIPEVRDTFQKYLRYTEDHPSDSSVRRIVVASEGRELAGLNADVRQIVNLRDFARLFYEVDDVGLSDNALRWMCGRGKEGTGKKLKETLNALFFKEGGVAKQVLRVFDGHKGVEREAVLWLVKQVATMGGYLAWVAGQEGVDVGNFRSAYITGAKEWLDAAAMYSGERRDAIQEADAIMSNADIMQFIERCAGESTARVAPWLNCKTDPERAELLRRCAVDGVVSNVVKDVYSEVAKYLNADLVFGDVALEEYFKEYRELKMTGRVTHEFYARAACGMPPTAVQSRNAIMQQYVTDNGCALLVVDAMGADWLPMLVSMARHRGQDVDSIAVGEAHLPTSTKFNNIYWPDATRRLPDIKRFDNIAHNGAEAHETRRAEENLAAALDVIGSEVLPRVAEGLARFERVLVTADHGSSRLAALACQSEPRLARTLACEDGAEADVADWRYRERSAKCRCPPEMEETLDGRYWVVRGYNRLPKKGGGQGFELHGGATLEERLVPVVIFSRAGQFTPKARTGAKRTQIVEKDDFDL